MILFSNLKYIFHEILIARRKWVNNGFWSLPLKKNCAKGRELEPIRISLSRMVHNRGHGIFKCMQSKILKNDLLLPDRGYSD